MKNNISEDQITHDHFFKKKIIVWQIKNGYRFSVDAPILADFLPLCPQKKALEIGTGCGIISLLALYKKKFSSVTGIEIQKPLYQLALINSDKNSLSHKFFPQLGDFNLVYKKFTGINIIFSNPPYIKVNQGRMSSNTKIRVAKAEVKLSLNHLLEKSHQILGPNGNLYLILPFARLEELKQLALEIGFNIPRFRAIHSFSSGKPERFLVQLSNYKEPEKKMNPLVIFKKKGIYTEEMNKILSG
jgi:tRNA1(Val) A37 N6-methylase TrmN6